jgi:hypothetical protein
MFDWQSSIGNDVSNQKFDNQVREAIWKAFGKKCLFCNENVLLGELHLDHLIPEYLSDHPEKLKELLKRTGSQNLDIFSLSNIAPTCAICNLQKTKIIFNDNRLMLLLSKIESKQDSIESYLKKTTRAQSIASILSNAEKSIQSGKFTPVEFITAFNIKFVNSVAGYVVETVSSNPATNISPSIKGAKFPIPIFFLGDTLSQIKTLVSERNEIGYKLHCLQYNSDHGQRLGIGDNVYVLRHKSIQIFYRWSVDAIQIFMVKNKTVRRKADCS